MVLFACIAVIVAAVPLLRGRLIALADLRLRGVWALSCAALLQVVILSAPSAVDQGVLRAGHLLSYAFAAVAVVANRRVPGLLLVALGGAGNLAAIAANGGVMPATPDAVRAAGLPPTTDGFLNSSANAGAQLAWLGDVFAIPAGWPLANVFSIGDVLLLVGAAVLVHRTCGSRLPWADRTRAAMSAGPGVRDVAAVPDEPAGPVAVLRGSPAFRRLWAAQTVSGIGDWVFTLTVVVGMADAGAAHVLAVLLLLQAAPAALTGLLAGSWIDRFDRRRLMVAADTLRAVAVATLLVVPSPALGHRYAVAVVLGAAGALFSPSLQASIPNVVARRDVVAANAALGATFHLAITVGPLLGGVLVAGLGARPAFALNALSFAASALLVRRVAIPLTAGRPVVLRGAIRAGLRYAVTTPLVRGMLAVGALVMVAASLKAPLEPLLVLDVLGGPATALGVVGAAWGLGMLAASLAGPRLVRRFARESLLAVGVAIVGVAVVAGSQVTGIVPLVILWCVGGFGNGLGTLCHDTLLQERTPDLLRGRVIAASDAVLDGASVLGLGAAALLGTGFGVRPGLLVAGGMLLGVAALTLRLVRVPAVVTAGESDAGSGEVVEAAPHAVAA